MEGRSDKAEGVPDSGENAERYRLLAPLQAADVGDDQSAIVAAVVLCGACKDLVGDGAGIAFGGEFFGDIAFPEAIDDAVGAIIHAINDKSVSGPVNVVSPGAVTNAEFAKTLARVLRKPQFLSIPASLASIIFGKLADELLLCSIRAEPMVLVDSGYIFNDPVIEPALRRILS